MKENEYYNLDLDLFYNVNCIPIHFATAGGRIPKFYQDLEYGDYSIGNTIKKKKTIFEEDQINYNPILRDIINFNNRIPEIIMVVEALYGHRPNILEKLNDLDVLFHFYVTNIYGSHFTKMAQKGFISFDKTDVTNHKSGLYHWVAMPKDFLLNNHLKDPHHEFLDLPAVECANFNNLIGLNKPFDLISLLND